MNALVGSVELMLRTPPRSLPSPGQMGNLTFSPERLHLFDPATGRRIERAS